MPVPLGAQPEDVCRYSSMRRRPESIGNGTHSGSWPSVTGDPWGEARPSTQARPLVPRFEDLRELATPCGTRGAAVSECEAGRNQDASAELRSALPPLSAHGELLDEMRRGR